MILEVQREIQENKINTAFPMLLCVKPNWNENQLRKPIWNKNPTNSVTI